MSSVIGFRKKQRVVDEDLLARVRQWPCCVCSTPGPSDPSHIRSRGAGGPDTDWNVMPMCRECHREWHSIGQKRFLVRYPYFMTYLGTLGWTILGDKLWHQGLK